MSRIVGYLLKLDFIPRGWLTVAAGFSAVLTGVVCLAGVSLPGVACPADPWVLVTGGLAAVGLGRRGQ